MIMDVVYIVSSKTVSKYKHIHAPNTLMPIRFNCAKTMDPKFCPLQKITLILCKGLKLKYFSLFNIPTYLITVELIK